jgi:hypothetical protein
MKSFETSATVEGGGEIHLQGVPYAPGTPVEVIINPKMSEPASVILQDAQRSARLLDALSKARNDQPISKLSRDDLYYRDVLRSHPSP